MGLKGEKRNRMYALSPGHKAYLLQQNQEARSSSSKPQQDNRPSYAASYGPSSASALLPRLVPQLTGDAGLMRRFSIVGWGGASTAPPVVSPNSSRLSGEFDSSASGKGKAQIEKMAEEMQPIQPQTTGGMWGGWWASAGGEKVAPGEKAGTKETNKSAEWYVNTLRTAKMMDNKLAKHLLSLRVHLSTAKLVWIEEFVGIEKGLDALGGLLAGLVGKSGKRKDLNEAETTVLLEIIKCFRVLLNTEVSSQKTRTLPLY